MRQKLGPCVRPAKVENAASGFGKQLSPSLPSLTSGPTRGACPCKHRMPGGRRGSILAWMVTHAHHPLEDSSPVVPREVDAEEASARLLRDLHGNRRGLSSQEAERRLLQYGPNVLERRRGPSWPAELARQLTHPLALLLWLAAALSFAVGNETVGVAVLLVIALNAAFAFVQELQAEKAVEALAEYMPRHVTVLRDGGEATVE